MRKRNDLLSPVEKFVISIFALLLGVGIFIAKIWLLILILRYLGVNI